MAKPYSLDLRERVVAFIDAGHSRREAAEQFSISHSSAIRWMARASEEGSPAAKPMGGKRRDSLESQRDWLLKQVKNHPDLTLDALLRQLERRRCKVCRNTLWRFLRAEGISFKKKRCLPRSKNALMFSAAATSGNGACKIK